MNDIVVFLDPFQGGGSALYVRAPYAVPNPHAVTVVWLDEVYALHGPDVVHRIGEMLTSKLRENTAVDSVLGMVLAHPGAPPTLPIAFRIGDPDAHALSWEAVVANGDFVALDDRWPITRIARGGAIPQEGATRTYVPPLRLVCVLSAVGRPAIKEWNGLYQAVKAARQAGLPIHVTLFAAEEQAVINVVRAVGDPQVTVEPVPNDATSLLTELERREPHLLHFYCHGTITDGVRRLEIGTVQDFDRNDGRSSVKVRVEELGTAMSRAGAWAVVLNTCRGAEATDQTLTHAEEVVSRGVPVAIGLRRLVDTKDAFAFSSTFYPVALRAIRMAVSGPDDETRTICWGDTLVQARRKLRDIHGADASLDDAWTLPVLYTWPGTFRLVVTDQADLQTTTEALGESEVIGDAVEVVGDDAPDDFLADLRGLAPNDGQ
jgi:hypothetical protein